MEIRPLSKHVGAEIGGVDASRPLSDDVFKTIDDAYNHYSVLVFRDQRLTPEQQIAFSRQFGELEISPRTQFALSGYPEILVLSNIIVDGKPIGNADAGRTWHTDMSYTKTPPRGSLLYAREIPLANGRALGDTVFSSAAAAYDTLSPEMKKKLTGLRAIHRAGAKKYAPGSKLADLVKDMPDVEHPVIRTHPVTGRKAIYVREGECVGICGMPDEESLMWDNSMTQHLAISDYQLPLRRLMHRVTVNGTVPI
jgi:taurine dioxygenase